MPLIVVNKRILWADACRVWAIFGVLLIHSSGEVFYSYGKIPIGYWLSANLLDSLARVAVPLFVMISGSLLLNSPDIYSISLFNISRRVGKVLLPLVVWSMVYLWWVDSNTPAKIIDPSEWLQKFLSQPVMYHLWFAYMIVGLYVLLPIFQVIFKACESSHQFQRYFLAVWMIINCLSIYVPMPFTSPMQISMVFGYGGYFILGGLLSSTRWINVALFKWATLYLTGVLATFLITWIRTKSTGIPDELAYAYFSPNVLFASIGAFMMIRKIQFSNELGSYFLKMLSDASFFVYFVHVLLLEFLRYGTFGLQISTSEIHPAISIPILALAVFIFSLAGAVVFRMIPGSRRFLG
ncbi:acyltransferase [Rhodoferax sp. BLA1]|uniref:acyltransferase n=1 Tax=Rhodoferax sp. BLA1 TaxID=2576062 RepID=UPI0015D3A1A2|nr:acyltransferase family protein [Rhodoferax sp. BLA1]